MERGAGKALAEVRKEKVVWKPDKERISSKRTSQNKVHVRKGLTWTYWIWPFRGGLCI